MIICILNLIVIIGKALLIMTITSILGSNDNLEIYSHLIVVDDRIRVTVTSRTGEIKTPGPDTLMKRSAPFSYVCTIQG